MTPRRLTDVECAVVADVCCCETRIVRALADGGCPDEWLGEWLPYETAALQERVWDTFKLFGWFDSMFAVWDPNENVH